MPVRKKLGDLLIEAGAIDELQLKAALAHQRQWGGRIGRTLVEMRFVDERQICDAVAKQLGIPSVRLLGRTVDPALLELVPQELCEKHWVFPIGITSSERGGDRLQVAMSDPTNLAIVDELRFRTGKNIEVAVAPDSQIDAAIRRYFYGETIADQRFKHGGPTADIQFGGREVDLAATAEGATPGPVPPYDPGAFAASAAAGFGSPPAIAKGAPAAGFGPPPAIPTGAPAARFGPRPAIPTGAPAADPLEDLFGPAGDARNELDELLGLGEAASPAPGPDAIDAARRALFAPPGGHAEVEEGPSFAPPAWAATPPPALALAPAPAWPADFPPDPGPAFAAPAAAPVDPAGEPPPTWGAPEFLEEVEVGADDAPLVLGTLIEPEAGAAPAGGEDLLELDPGVPEPIEPADPLDPLADEAALIAALESMAAGHEEPLPPGRLVAALALCLLGKGAIGAPDLLAALK
jgi:hypothetical protein